MLPVMQYLKSRAYMKIDHQFAEYSLCGLFLCLDAVSRGFFFSLKRILPCDQIKLGPCLIFFVYYILFPYTLWSHLALVSFFLVFYILFPY